MDLRAALRTAAAYTAGTVPALSTGAKFLIVCPPRTGSELLVRLLDSHPDIRCEGELFDRPRRQPLRYLDGRVAVARRRGHRAWGCKIINHQVRWYPERFGADSAFFRRAVDRGWTLVRLDRRDLLSQTLSVMHASRERWHYRTDDDAAFTPFVVDTAEFIATAYTLDDNRQWLDQATEGLVEMSLVYEDDLLTAEHQQRTVDRLAESLGLRVSPVSTKLRSIAPTSPRARIDNWDELVAALAHTRFREYAERAGHDAP